MRELTRERLIQLLVYDRATGEFRWKVSRGRSKAGSIAGRKSRLGYTQIRIDGRIYMSHRIAWLYETGGAPNGDIDHINGEKSDNRIDNLRDVTRAVNQQNRKTAQANNNSTGLLGAYKTGTPGRYFARIRVDGKIHHIGVYGSAEEAHQAYLQAKRKMHIGNTL